jgi:hypothetical protein
MATSRRTAREAPLTETETADIVTAVQSVFRKLKKLLTKVIPVYVEFGFKAPSAGVLARDLSERIEVAISQHCETFEKRAGHADLWRDTRQWEVKICKGSGMTINQSKVLNGESYIVVNYREDSTVSKIWVIWAPSDGLFSPRKPNSNARSLNLGLARASIQVLYEASPSRASNDRHRT